MKIEKESLRLVIWGLVILTAAVSIGAGIFIYDILTFVPPEEIIINITEIQ